MLLQRLARSGWSSNARIQTYLDSLLAPTAYWWVQQKSSLIRKTGSLKEFDQFWLSILLPTKTYDDIYSGWSRNQRFRAVARLEFLRSRYMDTPRYTQAISRLGDDQEDLPSRREILDLFGMESWDWKWEKNNNNNNNNNNNIPKEDQHKFRLMRERLLISGSGENEKFDLKSPIVDWDLEDVLEVGGCCVHGRSEFNLFAEEHQLYEVLTSDYVAELAKKIRTVLASTKGDQVESKSNFLVCEVGAGSGVLSHHLRRYYEKEKELDKRERERNMEIDVIATDPGTWNLGRRYPVEPYTNKEALKRLRPDLVLVSWMPSGEDWTESFRRSGVKSYLIIGEADDGCTGHNWKTWGNAAFREDAVVSEGPAMVPYLHDRYERTNLEGLAKSQLQRYDCKQAPYQSTTVLFSKKS